VNGNIPLSVLIVAIGVVGAGGCGSAGSDGPVGHLQGTVTIDGKPLPADARARMFFVPPASGNNRNRQPVTVEIVDGRYDATQVPAGRMTVTFDISRFTGKETPRERSVPLKEWESLVPEQYQQGLPIDVQEGEQTHDFTL